jgi:hypothetical protein
VHTAQEKIPGSVGLIGGHRLPVENSWEIVGYQEKIHRSVWFMGGHRLLVENS